MNALIAIKSVGVPPPGSLPSFQEIKDTLGFNRYYKEEKQYVVQQGQSSSPNGIILRLKITEKSGIQKIDEKIPAEILERMSKAIPGLAGVNFTEMLQGVDNSQKGKVLIDSEDASGAKIQCMLRSHLLLGLDGTKWTSYLLIYKDSQPAIAQFHIKRAQQSRIRAACSFGQHLQAWQNAL
ncbi:hypothetical protein GUJ93_ZPchr0015g6728 [Zizania palustris]|uniref:Uncharacterized protein n=1 Tax=Zizania palustris TaxID=103762 RepID=A0A8J5W0Y6_ZIZPA|nr:hypothetical protein GUJ93_ZPchr0015g6728 [Zizania palustris]